MRPIWERQQLIECLLHGNDESETATHRIACWVVPLAGLRPTEACRGLASSMQQAGRPTRLPATPQRTLSHPHSGLAWVEACCQQRIGPRRVLEVAGHRCPGGAAQREAHRPQAAARDGARQAEPTVGDRAEACILSRVVVLEQRHRTVMQCKGRPSSATVCRMPHSITPFFPCDGGASASGRDVHASKLVNFRGRAAACQSGSGGLDASGRT